MMSRANEIYNFEKDIERELKKIRESNDVNKDSLLRFYTQSVGESLSLARIRKRLFTARYLSQMLGMKFEDAKIEDIQKLSTKIEQKNVSDWTKSDYKKILKKFYKWLRNSDEAPPEVKWIKTGNSLSNSIMKKDLLTAEEVGKIIENVKDVQDKALFSLLFDSGRRLGEILGLRIGDIEFDSLGAILRVDGKVGKDSVRICASAPRLATWLDNHPDGKNLKSPLWVMYSRGKIHQMSYSSARGRLKRSVDRAGIKKRVWLYLFRHSRITPASTKLTYAEMCHVFGWKQGSDMPQFYVHLAGDDRDNAFLKMNGLEIKNNGNNENSNYVPVICQRCKINNSPDAKYCNGCGLGFDLKFAMETDQKKKNADEKFDILRKKLENSPEVVDKLLDVLGLLKN